MWESWEFFLFQIPVEFALGVWMVSGLFRKAAWTAGTAAYLGFIGVTLYKAMAGETSCGCFGRVEVDPWVTLFAIDVPFALLLLVFRPKGHKLLPPPWPDVRHAIATAVPIFAALIFTVPLLVALRPEFIQPTDWTPHVPYPRPDPRLQPVEPIDPIDPIDPIEPIDPIDPIEPVEPNMPEVIEPDPVIKPDPDPAPDPEPDPDPDPDPVVEAPPLWPWLEYIDIADQLTDGIVVAYMYHWDCSTCAESIPKYEAYNQELSRMGLDEFKIAYLAIPPYGPEGAGPVPADTTALHGKLTDQRRWAVTSPFVVALFEGKVAKTWPQGSSPEPDEILDEIFSP